MNIIQQFKYRPEVDGLRAVAVIAVVLFHAGLGFPGGFVGVDVFFVIAGYLITSLIIKDIEAEKFSMSDFWERRVRRILPASAVAVLVTLLAGWFILFPTEDKELGVCTVFLQTFCAANIYFWQKTNYFATSAEEQSLLDMWSLALEEQFYMIIPALLVLLLKVLKRRRREILIGFEQQPVCSCSLAHFNCARAKL